MGSKITRLGVTGDDKVLVVGDEEGSICIFDVHHGDRPNPKARVVAEPLPWSEEILVTRTDLEEKNQVGGGGGGGGGGKDEE